MISREDLERARVLLDEEVQAIHIRSHSYAGPGDWKSCFRDRCVGFQQVYRLLKPPARFAPTTITVPREESV